MSVNQPRAGDSQLAGRLLRRRWLPFTAAATAALLTAGAVLTAGGGSAGAATPLSQSTGRFLSGTVGGTSLDVLAGIEGESAKNPGNPGPNKNSLNAEVLNGALKIPLGPQGLQLPDPTAGAVQLGAVAQYAEANADGSALGASGAVDSNGGIGVGGSAGVPTGGATIDLAGSQAISAITSSLANLKLTIGAVSARAKQVAIGKTLADPSASCTSGGYQRIGGSDQAGKYAIAGLGLDLTSPLLANVTGPLVTSLGTVLSDTNITSILNLLNGSPLSGAIAISGVPTGAQLTTTIDNALYLSLANGSIVLNLSGITQHGIPAGGLHVDIAGLLKYLGLDINQLCPNTSLLPYVVDALLKTLPGVLGDVVTSLGTAINTLLGGITVTVATVPISAQLLGNLITSLGTSVGSTLSNSLGSLDTTLVKPLLKILTDNLLDLVANAQTESGGALTVTALQLKLLPGGGSAPLPNLPAFKTLPAIKDAQPNSIKVAKRVAAAAKKPSAPATQKSGSANDAVRLVSFTRPLAKAAADPAVQIDLAQASVGPNAPAPASSTSPTPSPSTSAPATNIPTGVPAGQGTTGGGTPVLPIVLVGLAVLFAAGGALSFRLRTRPNSH